MYRLAKIDDLTEVLAELIGKWKIATDVAAVQSFSIINMITIIINLIIIIIKSIC